MGNQRELTVDQVLDKLEDTRRLRQEAASRYRGKGIFEDLPEPQGVTSESPFARRKIGDWEKGYWDD